MKEKRAAIIADMRALNELAKTEARSFTDDEKAKYADMEKQVRDLTAAIEAEERDNALKGFSSDLPRKDEGQKRAADDMAEFRSFLADGKIEGRATMSISANGAVLAPTELVKDVVTKLETLSPIYTKVNRIPLREASGIDVPVETDAADASWSAEVPADEIGGDTTWAFAKKTINVQTLTKMLKVSKKLVKCSAIPIDKLVADQIAKKFAKAIAAGICSGRGETTYNEPLGLFVADANGVTTARDVTSTYSANAFAAADDFIDMVYKVDPAYRQNACWIMHSDIVKFARKLKDSQNQYLWVPGLREGEPDTFLGYPVLETVAAPNTTTSGSYVAVFGDLSTYWMPEVDNIEVQVLVEKYATTLQNGYLATALKGGMPTIANAFSRLKVGS